jgi:hypothetical protein
MSDAQGPASDSGENPSSDAAPKVIANATQIPTPPTPDVTDPAKLIRLGTMLQTVLAELHESSTDQGGLDRLAQIHRETVEELSTILSEDLQDELLEFNDCCGSSTPSEGELRVAHAQLVGWIQGLLRGMQATATAQAQMAQQQMMMMQVQAQQRGLAGGQAMAPPPGAAPSGPNERDSGYL